MNLSLLKEPMRLKDIEWRIQSCGVKDNKIWAMALCYVTSRGVQDRLDEVCGTENWKNEFAKAPDGGVMCGLSIKINGEWVTKWDGAENTDIEGVKGGLSGSMKRAAVQWGIGRYLYRLDETFVDAVEGGIYRGKGKDKATNKDFYFRWNPPAMPTWALHSDDWSETYLAEVLRKYIASKMFDHPENVTEAIEKHNISGMRKALAVAKEKEKKNDAV